MFFDRADAGRRLAAALGRFKDERTCILALPRGGVSVAFEIARALKAPLDLVIVRKIGAPRQPELALGAVVDGPNPELVLNRDIIEALGVPEGYVAAQKTLQLQEIERRRQAYLGNRPRLNVSGRTVLIVDDGIATGASIRAAPSGVRRARPKHLVLAVPVAPTDTIAELRAEADEVVCLESHGDFGAISMYYADFAQVSDATVQDLMSQAARLLPASSGQPAAQLQRT